MFGWDGCVLRKGIRPGRRLQETPDAGPARLMMPGLDGRAVHIGPYEAAVRQQPLLSSIPKELEVIGKGWVELISDFAANYANLNDAKASELAHKKSRRLAPRKKCFEHRRDSRSIGRRRPCPPDASHCLMKSILPS